MMDQAKREHLRLPRGHKKLLLHVCCAPCAGDILIRLVESKIDTCLFFFNPNIYPQEEYEKRREDMIRYAQKLGLPLVDGDYDHESWLEEVEGLEDEPEKGRRCDICIRKRLEKTAALAYKYRFQVIATTLSLSRWKDFDQITRCGVRAAKAFPGLVYWDYNWRKHEGEQQAARVAVEEDFYRQKYCGCEFTPQRPEP